ncbi:MAG TPA: F0F1 ATP synthase subunit B [Actinophytocola sp.]|uniref:F0F1 ATP synthase subunit B n=1 Tax=Actinophytocola sp. TaxID=1872138 RepID=UPI002DDC956B|nr:F0F1 ATP synthase subunit B [Actinophytocola sp.]HEV2779787.1 F0F1 ATP synthase subunit B [Actinophytocola sp.]
MDVFWETVVEVVALVVIGWVVWRYVRPPVGAIIRNQRETIQKQVEASRAAHERLQTAQRKYEEAIAEARTEAAKIRDTARADGQRIVEEMRAQAEREVERIRQRGQEDLATQRQQVIRELRARIGELTVTSATELVTAHLSEDANRASTVDHFLAELEAMAAPEAPAPAGRGKRKVKGEA